MGDVQEFELAPTQWPALSWREGSNFTLRSRFARVRVRAAHRDQLREQRRPAEWLLIEWPEGHREPMKYWLSTLPEDMSRERRVFEGKMRWRMEQARPPRPQAGVGAWPVRRSGLARFSPPHEFEHRRRCGGCVSQPPCCAPYRDAPAVPARKRKAYF